MFIPSNDHFAYYLAAVDTKRKICYAWKESQVTKTVHMIGDSYDLGNLATVFCFCYTVPIVVLLSTSNTFFKNSLKDHESRSREISSIWFNLISRRLYFLISFLQQKAQFKRTIGAYSYEASRIA